MLGTTEILIIAFVVVLLFGANKLPKLGGAIGESIKNFKRGVNDGEQKAISSETKSDEQKKA